MSSVRYCIHGNLIAPAPEEMRCPEGCTRQASQAEIYAAEETRRLTQRIEDLRTPQESIETQTPVFTEEEVHMIGGYLAERWSGLRDATSVSNDIDASIRAVLSRAR